MARTGDRPININLLEFVRVKLTFEGVNTYNQYCKSFGLKDAYRPNFDRYYTDQLWRLIEIFGRNLDRGGHEMFESMDIEVL